MGQCAGMSPEGSALSLGLAEWLRGGGLVNFGAGMSLEGARTFGDVGRLA